MAQRRAPAGFTLLECMMALLLISTTLVILMESQSWAVRSQDRAARISTATMLASEVMTLLELRMAKEGFGELEVHERGDFGANRFAGAYEDFRWEYEVEKVEVKLPNLGQLMGMAGDAAGEAGDAAGISTGGAAPANDLMALESLGIDLSMFGDMMGNFLREARVRVCFPDGNDGNGMPVDDCVEFITHLVNPTGRVMSEEEQLLLESQEDLASP
jgi:prepilin-type N-terminal cleavage/methylation domain-containing protein